MVSRLLICLLLLTAGHTLVAQERPVEDSEPAPDNSKAVSHYIGLQANQLIRQLISFGGNNSAVTNPYALTYSINSKRTGFGFSTGIGYASNKTKTTDVFTSTTSTIDDFAWRFGLEKKTYLSRHWLLSFGGDILIESNKAETVTNSGSTPNPTVTTTAKRYGFGPRLALNYQFNNKILVGTEASFYFKWIDQTQKTTGITPPPNTKPETNSSLRAYNFTLPAVVFLMLKL